MPKVKLFSATKIKAIRKKCWGIYSYT